jgi:microcystin-dependent protein
MFSERLLTRSMMGLLTAAVVGLGYNQMRARADGIPPTQTLTYAGTLDESNTPVNGVRNLRLTLWDDATSTTPSRARCLTEAPNYAVTNGRFQVTLDSTCTAAVRATPDLWMEIQVNGVSMGRSKLGAVPFAVEAARASELTLTAANALVPTGTVVAFAGRPERVPSGWLLCDGRSLVRDMYPALFNAVGTSYGGDGTNFNLPDLRGRSPIGAGAGVGLTARNLGERIGAETHSLTVDEMPSHTHSQQPHTHDDSGHSHGIATEQPIADSAIGRGAGYALAGIERDRSTTASARASIQSATAVNGTTGGGRPHSNMPPSIAVNYIIKS